jgi:phosphoglycolate phosphatase
MKTIGFDFDMTLANSDLGLLSTLANIFPDRVTMKDPSILRQISGLPIRETLLHFSSLQELDKNLEKFFALYPRFGIPNSTLMPGALRALDAVQLAGFKAVIISAKSKINLELMLEHFGLSSYLRYADCYGIKKAEAISQSSTSLYIGDQESDVYAAHLCGIPAIRLIDSTRNESSNADWTLQSLEYFPEWLDNHLESVLDDF